MERLERPIDAELVVDYVGMTAWIVRIRSLGRLTARLVSQTISEAPLNGLGGGVGVRRGTETERRRLERRLSQDAFGPRYVRIKACWLPGRSLYLESRAHSRGA